MVTISKSRFRRSQVRRLHARIFPWIWIRIAIAKILQLQLGGSITKIDVKLHRKRDPCNGTMNLQQQVQHDPTSLTSPIERYDLRSHKPGRSLRTKGSLQCAITAYNSFEEFEAVDCCVSELRTSLWSFELEFCVRTSNTLTPAD
jgi:hypothetical protein